MIIPRWRKVDRKRHSSISYSNPDFVKYYDIDLDDFEYLVNKLKNNERLTEAENDRYGVYIVTMCIIVQQGPKFKNKPLKEREEMIEQQYFELLTGITTFDPKKGRLYSYAYRIAYVAAVHYYTDMKEEKERQEAITDHCYEELNDYLEQFKDHKVRGK